MPFALPSSPNKPSYITGWKKFEKNLSSTSFPLPNISSSENIEQEMSNFTQFFSTTACECTFVFSSTNPKQDFPQHILRKIVWKRHLYSHWQRTRELLIKSRLNTQAAHVRNLILSHCKKKYSWFCLYANFLTTQ